MPSLSQVFKNNSDAIREKTLTTDLIAPINQAAKIETIEAVANIIKMKTAPTISRPLNLQINITEV